MLHYNWNRYYDPKTGRYTQTDPIGFNGEDSNLYRYVENTPNSGFDPYGLITIPFTNIWIPAGEEAGQKAAMYWAEKSIDQNNKWYETAFYNTMGVFASLWTPCTSDATLTTLTAAYGAGKFIGNMGRTTLYRAATPEELADIKNVREFRNPPGSESKYFTDSYKNARSYGDIANSRFKDGPYTVVRTSIPNGVLSKLPRTTPADIPGGLPTVEVPTGKLPSLSKPKILRY